MSFNVEVDVIQMAKKAMKEAGFKKKDIEDPVFMKEVISKIMNENVFEEHPEGKEILMK